VAIEHACTRVVSKPWGSTNLLPWSDIQPDGVAIGELWFQRSDVKAPDPSLLLKLLFTKEPLSIQVHPDDAFAHSIGLVNGKTEAWYILSATPEAKVAVGLQRQLTAPQLRASIEDGSIADLIQWRRARKGDVIFVPAGTIHAIGPGLVLAEIQQRSDTTFRLFDHGREREIHLDNAVAAANAGPAERQSMPQRLTDARSLLVASPHFVLERIDLPPNSHWKLRAEQETWILVIEGHAQRGRDALAPAAPEEDGEHVADDGGQAGERDQQRPVLGQEAGRAPHGQKALQRVACQHQPGPPFAERAGHVGGADVPAADRAHIDAAGATDDETRGKRPQQVRAKAVRHG